ncbi:MAG: hypothetical protein EBS05_18645 [Proteobacteria bacterium]|nr:hypothetical protein [Pseudomonadota bacterium]
MNATTETTATVNGEAEKLPTTPATTTPTEELLRLLPPTISVWVPKQLRDTTEAEDRAMERFVRFLPVSPQLDSTGLTFLTRFVAVYFEGRDGVAVSPQQVVEAWDRYFVKHQHPTTLPIVRESLRAIFGSINMLVIGQLEIEHNATTGTMTLRRNIENYYRLIEFLGLLDGEMLA